MILKADGFDEAIIGVTWDTNAQCHRMVYDIDVCLDILMKKDNMSEHDAIEFFEFNTLGAHVGNQTPLFVFSNYEGLLESENEN